MHQHEIVRTVAGLLDADLATDATALRGRRVALFGLVFKANTENVRRSAALAIASPMRSAGASVGGTNPRAADHARRADPEMETAANPVEAAHDADAVVVVTEWPAYRVIDWRGVAEQMRSDLVYDTRAVVDVSAARAAGLRVERLGQPGASAEP